MPNLTTLEASTRVVTVFRSPSTTVRKLDANFVAHEVAFVIFCNALFSGFTSLEFLQSTVMVACLLGW